MVEESNSLTEWIEIPITSTTKCSECENEIMPGLALWSKSAKLVKHLTCKKERVRGSKCPIMNRSVGAGFAGSSGRNWVKEPEAIELKCFICGNSAGCQKCIFANSCNREIVSQSCICERCMVQMQEGELRSLDVYQKVFLKKAKITKS
ncbi:MAG: hypothetical protein WBP64_08460 [Nitrososphaeraceae archaeon]